MHFNRVDGMDERVYWLAWHIVMAGQARRFWEIIDHFGDPVRAWQAPDEEFGPSSGLMAGYRNEALERRRKTDLERVAAELEQPGAKISLLFYHDSGYPEQLRNIYDPPPVLYLRGDKSALQNVPVALVGSRRATPYGLHVAENLARELAAAGVGVVSGMARGIDTAAHRGALKGGGNTVAVLGCGVDVVYPRENARLLKEIAAAGAVISEFPPGFQPEPWHFPVRNRVISGLSRVVVVVEAAAKSGALITAGVALEQGRDVMVVPGQITSRLSRGSNSLLKQGAAPVLGAGDILEELGLGTLFAAAAAEPGEGLKLTGDEMLLYGSIDLEPVSVETLVQKTGIPAGRAMSALMYLEMKGLVRQMPGRLYVRAR